LGILEDLRRTGVLKSRPVFGYRDTYRGFVVLGKAFEGGGRCRSLAGAMWARSIRTAGIR
jgi:hypothetical protein